MEAGHLFYGVQFSLKQNTIFLKETAFCTQNVNLQNNSYRRVLYCSRSTDACVEKKDYYK